MKKNFTLLLSLLSTLLLFSCDISRNKTIVEDVLPQSIELNLTTLTLEAGYSRTLTATVMPITTQYKDVLWSSSDSSIAEVNEMGVVVGVDGGNATITATSTKNSAIYAECAVTVNPKVVNNDVMIEVTTLTQTELAVTAKPNNLELKYLIYPASDEEYYDLHEENLTQLAEAVVTYLIFFKDVDIAAVGPYVYSGKGIVELDKLWPVTSGTNYNIIAFAIDGEGSVASTPTLTKATTLEIERPTGALKSITATVASGTDVRVAVDAGDYTGNYIVATVSGEMFETTYQSNVGLLGVETISYIKNDLGIDLNTPDNKYLFSGNLNNFKIAEHWALTNETQYILVAIPVLQDGTLLAMPIVNIFTTL